VGKFRQGFYPLGIELLGLLRKPAILLHLVHLQQTSLTLYRETFEASFCRYG
jgi:cytosine/adenosine deaminase-related metal-dependent hydrolase